MRLSQLFSRSVKDVADDEVSINARLLIRAGFIDKTMAGVYAYLPLGLRVLANVSRIVREEMNAVGGQEVLLPALQPKEFWDMTGRWDVLDVLFKVPSAHGGRVYALGPTHEEVVVPLMKKFVHSYRDLPQSVYQIQTKFRDEARAKSGLLRGREFLMKDLYSFHATEHDLDAYYSVMQHAYARVFARCGLDAIETMASGGTFSKYSHEYQVITEHGEDTVFRCACGYAVNDEIAEVKAGDRCPMCGSGVIEEHKAIEVGNIFKLMRKYSDPFSLTYVDESGVVQPVFMGCFGIGISRLMGAIAEVHHDDRGLIWPEEIAPARLHIVALGSDDRVTSAAEMLVRLCDERHIAYVYDDRGLSAGAALGDADLMGMPYRALISERSLAAGGIELVRRGVDGNVVVLADEVITRVS